MIEFKAGLRADGVDCWSENTQLEFDNVTKQYSNFPGVKTWIPGWGQTDTVDYVDPSWLAWLLGNLGAYAKYFVDGSQYAYTLCLKKVPTFKLSVTLSNFNRFKTLLHCWKAHEIWYKRDVTLPTSP